MNKQSVIHVRHILVQHKYEAEDLYKKLQEGSSFEDLAKKYSLCSSAKNGGDLGFVPSKKFDLEFLENILHLKVKTVSKPFKTRYGFHLAERLS